MEIVNAYMPLGHFAHATKQKIQQALAYRKLPYG